MKLRELLESPDFINKEMPTYVRTTIEFYSENTMREMFDTIATFEYLGKKTVVLMAKTKKFAVIGTMGVRPEDKKNGMYIIGTVDFKSKLNLSYDKDIPGAVNALQVDVVEISDRSKRRGYGVLLYFNLAKYGYEIISDNVQYLGGKALWKKMASVAGGKKLSVYIVKDGIVLLDNDGRPKRYTGDNIVDADIWRRAELDARGLEALHLAASDEVMVRS